MRLPTPDKLARKWLLGRRDLVRWAGVVLTTAATAGWTAHKVVADGDTKLQAVERRCIDRLAEQDKRIAVDETQRAALKEEIVALREDLRDFRRELAVRRGLARQQP